MLFNHVNLSLIFAIIHLQILKLREVVSVCLFEILHLSQKDELFFINNVLFACIFKHILSLSELLVSHTDLPLLFFPIETCFQNIDFFLVNIQFFSQIFDINTAFFNLLTETCDSILQNSAFLAIFKFYKSYLFINCFSLFLFLWLMRRFICFRKCVSWSIFTFFDFFLSSS